MTSVLVLLLMVGLGVNVGYFRYQKYQMQKAADAGALAAAAVIPYSANQTLIRNAAYNEAAANGFANGTHGITVTVNHPPSRGPFAGIAPYAEVYVVRAAPRFFMSAGACNSADVRARAVGLAKAGNTVLKDDFPNDGGPPLKGASLVE